jgi:cytidine deaminase
MTTNRELFDLATAAADNAYSPYSRVRVGAAVETDQGMIYTGCNVENASYGLTVCAERVAIFSMVADGGRALQRVAVCVIAPDGGSAEPVPCGACLQCIAEFADDDALVITSAEIARPLKAHLPLPFRLDK